MHWPREGGAGAGANQKGWLRRLLTGQKTSTDVIKVNPAVDSSLIQEAAKATDGFSGRELAKMVASMQVGHFHYFTKTGKTADFAL